MVYSISRSQYNFHFPSIKRFVISLSTFNHFIVFQVFRDGAPERLTNGMDFRGEVCGKNRLEEL